MISHYLRVYSISCAPLPNEYWVFSHREPVTRKSSIKTLLREIETRLQIATVDVEITIREPGSYQGGLRGIAGNPWQQ